MQSWVFFGGENLRVVAACGGLYGCVISAQGIHRVDPMEYAIRRGLVWPNEARGDGYEVEVVGWVAVVGHMTA